MSQWMSVFQIFKVGIGPSSSHTMGPMKASREFCLNLEKKNLLAATTRIKIELYGSLALTGIGHCTDKALLLGLLGESAESIDPDLINSTVEAIKDSSSITLLKSHAIAFNPKEDLIWNRRKSLPHHPNGMMFSAYGTTPFRANAISSPTFDQGAAQELQEEMESAKSESLLLEEIYYSVGGGRILTTEQITAKPSTLEEVKLPYPFSSGDELLVYSERDKCSIAQIILANESVFIPKENIITGLNNLWFHMQDCMERGCRQEGVLPGKLQVKRRAPKVYKDLLKTPDENVTDPLTILDWVNLYALAVNEENASGSRVVTAPTNGAAGIIPAVLRYYERFCAGARLSGIHDFLLTAAGIGMLYAQNASISGAEVGCQGEVGVACSMAAGGLVAAMKGTPKQVEQAAEIGMEHNLGLTCDPIGGLVQIPCIERNAMGAVKAINAARIALRGDGNHYVSLDSVIRTMRQTGADMKTKYKETSRGGLAVNVTEC